jgi:glycosidase
MKEQTIKPIIYQVFTRLFGNQNTTRKYNGTIDENGCGKMNDFDAKVLRRIRHLGVTHVWYTGIIRHATTTDYTRYGIPQQHAEVVKGKAGSPYAITDYYDVDPDLAVDIEHRMEEFEALIERTHQAGMKVVMDFVPNHVAREYHSVCKPAGVKDLGEDDDTSKHFSTQNNFYYMWGAPLTLEASNGGTYTEVPAKATGNDQFTATPTKNDWYETVKLNYGIDYCDAGGRSEHFNPIPDTWHKMTDILLFWAKKGVDAFRCDMAEMVPTAFWRWAIDKVRFQYPDIKFIGEVYNPTEYRNYIGAGFDWLYDKVGMYDCVRDVICGYRRAGDISLQWQATDDIRDHMLYFLENHDEQRIASDFFAGNPMKAVPGFIVSLLLQTNPFMLYAGQEFGEEGMDQEGFSGKDGRTTIFDYWCVEALRRGFYDRDALTLQQRQIEGIYKYMLNLVNEERALAEGDFFDLMYVNQHIADKQYAFMRQAGNENMLIIVNFDEKAASCEIVIPDHAIDYFGLERQEYNIEDIFTGEVFRSGVYGEHTINIDIPAYSVKIFKMIV